MLEFLEIGMDPLHLGPQVLQDLALHRATYGVALGTLLGGVAFLLLLAAFLAFAGAELAERMTGNQP